MHTVLGTALTVCVLMSVWGAALVGYGAAACAVIGITDEAESTPLGDLGLVGFATFALLAAALHFFVPLGGWPSAALLLIGLGFAGLRRRVLRMAAAYAPGLPVFFLLGVLIPAFSVALVGPRFLSFFDTRLYHLQTILWDRDSAIVLGLANLHTRFGYNSIWLLISAALSLPRLSLQSMFVGNSLVAIFSLLAILQRLVRSWGSNAGVAARIFGLGALFSWAGCVVLMAPTSPDTDMSPALLVIEVFYLAMIVATESAGFAPEYRSRELALLVLLSAFAITLKTSQVVVTLVPLVFAVAALSGRLNIRWRPPMRAAAFGTLLVAVWMLRGVALSGCLIYPSSKTCLARLPWAVEPAAADAEARMIKAWPRNPGMAHREIYPPGWSWLGRWTRDLLHTPRTAFVGVLFMLTLASLAHGIFAGGRAASFGSALPKRQQMLVAALLLCAVSGVVFWFILAPDVRFGAGFLSALPLLVLAATLPLSDESFRQERVTPWLAAVFGRLAARPILSPLTAFLAVLMLGTACSGGPLRHSGWPSIPRARVIPRLTGDGAVVYSPWPNPLTTREQCWAAPRPCTPQFVPSLRFGRFARWQMITRGRDE